jgi:Cof subfamily protein (haloacid dehalogenase superfamily)
MIRLLAVDIDGTLLDSGGRIPEAHRGALAEASAQGIAIALVTGRSYHFTRHIADALSLPLTLIVNNGAVVKQVDGVTLMRHVLPRETAVRVLAGTRAFEECVAVVFDRQDERQIVFERMDWAHPHRKGYYERNRAFIAAVSPLSDALTEDPIQVMFNGAVAPMRALAGELRAMPAAGQFSVALTEYEQRDFSLLDVNGAGCSKGSTLARWTGACGFTRDQVMAVGDNLNDLDMLEFAGTAVVMGNAAGSLKACGFHLTGTNDEDGLATAIRSLAMGISNLQSPGAE